MKKLLVVLMLFFVGIAAHGQSVVKTGDGKYTAYCEIKGYSISTMGKVLVLINLGNMASKSGAYESIIDEDGKTISFSTMMAAVNYMAKRGWTLNNVYFLTDELSHRNVAHYILEKRVSSDYQIREGIMTKVDN